MPCCLLQLAESVWHQPLLLLLLLLDAVAAIAATITTISSRRCCLRLLLLPLQEQPVKVRAREALDKQHTQLQQRVSSIQPPQPRLMRRPLLLAVLAAPVMLCAAKIQPGPLHLAQHGSECWPGPLVKAGQDVASNRVVG